MSAWRGSRTDRHAGRAVFVSIGLTAAAAAPGWGAAAQAPPAAPGWPVAKFVAAANALGFETLAKVARGETTKNVAVSPVGLALALDLAYDGASGETRQAMARVLRLEGVGREGLARAGADLRAMLARPDPYVHFVLASSFWVHDGLTFAPDFLARCKDSYDARTRTLPPDETAVAQINMWVREASEGTMERMVEAVKPETSVLLASLAYFTASWATRFDAGRTKEAEFTRADGKRVLHPMMFQSGKYGYFRSPMFQGVRLPFGDGRLGMVILLPGAGSSLADLLGKLDLESWKSWSAAFETKQGVIILPRFHLESALDLVPALRNLGLQAATDPRRAEFSALCSGSPRPALGQIEHKTVVELNEAGVAMPPRAPVWKDLAEPRATFRMIMDRPFLWAIHDDRTGAVLAVGTYVTPE